MILIDACNSATHLHFQFQSLKSAFITLEDLLCFLLNICLDCCDVDKVGVDCWLWGQVWHALHYLL